jgi:hypothetical protein
MFPSYIDVRGIGYRRMFITDRLISNMTDEKETRGSPPAPLAPPTPSCLDPWAFSRKVFGCQKNKGQYIDTVLSLPSDPSL